MHKPEALQEDYNPEEVVFDSIRTQPGPLAVIGRYIDSMKNKGKNHTLILVWTSDFLHKRLTLYLQGTESIVDPMPGINLP